MNIFLLMDHDFDCNQLQSILNNKPAVIYLYPLTSHFLLLENLKNKLKAMPQVQLKILDNAMDINNEVTRIQKSIAEWSSQIGEYKIHSRKLKEWFVFPDQSGSAWWLGMMSEKNCVQDNVFFKIAQVNAIKKFLTSHEYDAYFFAITDKTLAHIMRKMLHNLHKPAREIKLITIKTSLKDKLFSFIKHGKLAGAILAACLNWFIWLRQSRQARKMLPPLHTRLKANNPLLFISYFPNIDEQAAKQGQFRNKYALALQNKLQEMDRPITWLLMPVFYNNYHFDSAIRLAKKFIIHGENIFVLQEFFSKTIFIKSVLWWFRQVVYSIMLYPQIDKISLMQPFTCVEAHPYIKYLWRHSFVGTSGIRGIIFYLTYREVFKKIPNIKKCIYYCEMQAWEKAMIMAKKNCSPKMYTLAFQHTTVIKNHYNYFYSPKDLIQNGTAIDFPLPDKLIANGKQTYQFLAESKYPNLCEGEAIRQLYLSERLYHHNVQKTQPVLFVAGSFDRNEMRSLITMVYLSFPKAHEFAIWFKGSPVNPLEPIFAELGIDFNELNYKILHQDIADILTNVSVTVSANTTVSVEAAASGCPVIIPIFADVMLMNPIVDTKARYFLVGNVDEFKATVQSLIYQQNDKYFLSDYWNLDSNLPLWTKLLYE